jgi:hypothetical protein
VRYLEGEVIWVQIIWVMQSSQLNQADKKIQHKVTKTQRIILRDFVSSCLKETTPV